MEAKRAASYQESFAAAVAQSTKTENIKSAVVCVDLREDKMINPAQGFWPIFGPLGPTAGPGSPGNGRGSTNSAGCNKNQPRIPTLSPMRGHFAILGPTAKI